jgi:hypothetical protein
MQGGKQWRKKRGVWRKSEKQWQKVENCGEKKLIYRISAPGPLVSTPPAACLSMASDVAFQG